MSNAAGAAFGGDVFGCDGCDGSVAVGVSVGVVCCFVACCLCTICSVCCTTWFVACTRDSTIVCGSPHLPGALLHAMSAGSGRAALTCVKMWL